MTLLSRHRRRLGFLVAGFFGFLLLSNLIPDPVGGWKVRRPIDPGWSWTRKAEVMVRNVPAFIGDNFGFRATMPVLRRAIRTALGSPDTTPIYVGRAGQLFWALDRTPEQSAGALVRAPQLARFVTMIGEMQRVLAPAGTQLVVALPPNAQSVEVEALPEWTDRLTYPTTEYTLALGALAAEGVTTVDLRQALRATPAPRYLLTDTHWNRRSAVIAFNAVVAAAGHPDWQVDLQAAVGSPVPFPGGDLRAAMRMPPEIKAENFRILIDGRAPPRRDDPALVHHNMHPAFRSYARDYGPSGPRILILGDSFTADVWDRLFQNAKVSVVGWMHASHTVSGSCDFNFNDVRDFRPDILIYARTERFFICPMESWPQGLARPEYRAIPPGVAP